MSQPVANARMYSATPQVGADWKTLLHWVLDKAALPWEVIAYAAPAPLSVLWARDDLGVAMMCGLPYALRTPKPLIVAAPVPSPARYGGKAVYFTDMVVRADSPYQSLEDSFGGIAGYTLADSMSGGVAFAHHLEQFRTPSRPRLYKSTVGNLIHARGVIDALARGLIDVGPLDSYYHDLLKRNDPAFAAKVRTVTSTKPIPIPPLVATAPLTQDQMQRLREAFSATQEAPELGAVMERLLLAAFASPCPADYDLVAAIAAQPHVAFEDL
jgi:ABC-type phosphate/phosphonate transport system substrate-binding protein